ncbi:putative Calpain catalytic domain-containing protein [Seiridium cardinale]|uniref:Calpain catalytic domain-containing protein n=1 Tax=Seiridium cardinale TaxID=138064 RepID=A0ABR2XE61_9PEZI
MHSKDTSSTSQSGHIDLYAFFGALHRDKIDRDAPSEGFSRTSTEDYDDLSDFTHYTAIGKEPQPDHPPEDSEINVGAINPYALVEAVLGHRLNHSSTNVARVVSDILQTDYDELFDMKYNSVLYIGLALNEKERRAEELNRQDIRIFREQDLVAPDLSRVQKLGDLKHIGLRDLNQIKVKLARLQNGKLHIVLDPDSIPRNLSNRNITRTLNELASPFRVEDERSYGVPPNCAWRFIDEAVSKNSTYSFTSDFDNRLHLGPRDYNGMNVFADSAHVRRYNGPVQGATSNSWFVAAVFSAFWSDPTIIHQVFRGDGLKPIRDSEGNLQPLRHLIKFFDKGGRNNAETRIVEVDYEVPINKTSNEPVYCRAAGGTDYWPALYEKAFAMWITRSDSDRPDITQTAHGDPVKAMAQIDGREPQYYFTENHDDVIRLVRYYSVNFKTISPMCAFTYASGNMFRGSNLVANHAYSVLGWSNYGDRQYIVVRNPWGVTEPRGLTSYPGLIDRVEPSFWPPASLLDGDGVLAIEARCFREYFACIGRTK